MKNKALECILLVSIFFFLVTLIHDVPVFCAVRSEAYTNHTHGFSINPPSGWTVDESSASGIVFFYGPVVPETGGRVNINIVVGTTNLSLDQYVSAAKSQYPQIFTNYHLVSEGSRDIGGLGGYELVSTFTQGLYDFKNKQVFFVEKGKAYVITFTTLPTNYDTYLSTFEESLQTFKLIGPEFPWQTILILVVVIAAGLAIGITIFLKRRKAKVEPPPAIQETPSTTTQHYDNSY